MEVSNGELGACGQPCQVESGATHCRKPLSKQVKLNVHIYSKLVKVTPTILPLVLIADVSVGMSRMYVCCCFNCGPFLW